MLSWIQRNKNKVLSVILVSGVLAGAALLHFTELDMEDIREWIQFWTEEIRTWNPVVFFLIVALLPLIGFPISPLFIIAAVRFGVGWAIPFSMTALAVNLILAYWISTKLLHWFIEKIASHWNYSIPKSSPKNAAKWVFVVRISGAPLAVQNYILGLAHVPFWPYLIVSLAVQSFFVVGMIVFGESFISGDMGKALIGLAILVMAFVAVSYFRKRYAQSKSGSVNTPGPGN